MVLLNKKDVLLQHIELKRSKHCLTKTKIRKFKGNIAK